ncbi:Hypothetical protein FNO222_0840 [Francisella orientalis]|uniref:Uncharacterized protein n=1 Tax=Francisella orientalis TaxID=299583 RepID=A0ABM5U5Q4_9GAMM|nr:hypothetical protein FNO12_0836 [Francisella orientalis FNO12]AKN87056.1 Hypothetical protein FNO24_0836 [Francisella orientalis FNO24]AKN88594.1 Hypothetical protein FNO190_0836 [Francisella orientalis]AKU05350.1 Hypothetical protein FNO01_0836 [Francisella orientalis]QEN20260.1 Hypothetical protein FNO39_0840 [Francisella orientalis]
MVSSIYSFNFLPTISYLQPIAYYSSS